MVVYGQRSKQAKRSQKAQETELDALQKELARLRQLFLMCGCVLFGSVALHPLGKPRIRINPFGLDVGVCIRGQFGQDFVAAGWDEYLVEGAPSPGFFLGRGGQRNRASIGIVVKNMLDAVFINIDQRTDKCR